MATPDTPERKHEVTPLELFFDLGVLIWFTVTTPLWIAGAAGDTDARVVWWADAP